MAEKLERVRLDVAYLGIDVDSAPAAMGKAKGFVVQNYLTGASGRLKQRGAILHAGLGASVTSGRLVGYFRGRDRLLLGFSDHASAARVIEPWVAPYKISAAAALAQAKAGANEAKEIDLIADTSTNRTPTNRGLVPGPALTNYGKFSYSIAYDSVDGTPELTNERGGLEWKRRILRWNSDAMGQPVSYTNMPGGGQDLKVHYGRLLVLGGTLSFATYIDHHALFYTRPLSTTDYTTGINLADANFNIWNENVEGDADVVANKLNLPGDTTDYGVKMARAGRHLAILQRHSILLLTGYGPESWQLRTFAEGVGCLDPRSVCEASDGCFFLSEQGYMFFDGVQLKDVSEGLHKTLVAAGLAAVGDEGVPGGFAQAERLTNEYILLTIGTADFASSPSTPSVSFCGLYHLPSGSWSTFESELLTTTNKGPIWIGRTENRQFVADHATLYNAPYLTVPENIATESSRGKDGANVIKTKWHSRTAELAAPFSESQISRVLIDYEWQVDGDAGGTEDGPTVTVLDADSGATLKSYSLPRNPPDPPVGISRARHMKEINEPCRAVQVKIEYTTTARALVASSILDVFVEYQIGRELR